jgi:hypothetical protein
VTFARGLTVPLAATASSGLPISFIVDSGPALLTGSMLTVTGPGVVAITVIQAGNLVYNSSRISRNLQVNRGPQSLTFESLGAVSFAPGKTVRLSAVSSAGLPVSYTNVSGPAALDGDLLTMTGVGTVWVQAEQPGNDFYSPAIPALQSLAVTAVPQTIVFDPPSVTRFVPGLEIPLTANASSGLPISFTLLSGPASLNGNRLIITGAGSVVIAAGQAGDGTFAPAATVQRTLSVDRGTQSITFDALAEAEFSPGLTVPLPARAGSGLPVSYTVTSGPATLAGDRLKVDGAGTIVITAMKAGDGNYEAATPMSQTVQIRPGRQAIAFNPPTPFVYYFGSALPLRATASSGLPVELSLVSGPGAMIGNLLSLRGSGTFEIQASQRGDGNYLAATTVTRTVIVTGTPQSITFTTSDPVAYAPDKAIPLLATASSGLPVTFSVESGPGSISGNQLVLHAAGTIQITATQPGDSQFAAAIPVTLTFQVDRAAQALGFEPLPDQALGSAALPLVATSDSGLPVSFSIVAGPAVIENGRVRCTGVGVVQIAAIQAGDDRYQPAASVIRSLRATPGLAIAAGSTAPSLKIWMDSGAAVLLEESGDFQHWTTSQTVSGTGASDPVVIPLPNSPTGQDVRFWRLRTP